MPVALYKGVRRRTILKLKKMLLAVEAMDTRESNRAQRLEVLPEIFFDNQTLRNASQKIIDQIDDLLSKRR